MRYYVTSIQYNKLAQAENRSVPFAFDDINSARQKFHDVLANDMKNPLLGWSVAFIFNSEGALVTSEKWEKVEEPVEPEVPETESEE